MHTFVIGIDSLMQIVLARQNFENVYVLLQDADIYQTFGKLVLIDFTILISHAVQRLDARDPLVFMSWNGINFHVYVFLSHSLFL